MMKVPSMEWRDVFAAYLNVAEAARDGLLVDFQVAVSAVFRTKGPLRFTEHGVMFNKAAFRPAEAIQDFERDIARCNRFLHLPDTIKARRQSANIANAQAVLRRLLTALAAVEAAPRRTRGDLVTLPAPVVDELLAAIEDWRAL